MITTEFLEGKDLFSLIEKKPLGEYVARKFALQLIPAFVYMHQKEVYHADIKLENIFLEDESLLKIIDFGLCCHERQTDWRRGTPGYVAP